MTHPTQWTRDKWEQVLGVPVQILDNHGEARVINLYLPPDDTNEPADQLDAIYLHGTDLPTTAQFKNTLWTIDADDLQTWADGRQGGNYQRTDQTPHGDEPQVTRDMLGGVNMQFTGDPEPDVTFLGLTFNLETVEDNTAIYV